MMDGMTVRADLPTKGEIEAAYDAYLANRLKPDHRGLLNVEQALALVQIAMTNLLNPRVTDATRGQMMVAYKEIGQRAAAMRRTVEGCDR